MSSIRERRQEVLEQAMVRKVEILSNTINNPEKRELLEEYLVHNGLVLIPLGNLTHRTMSLIKQKIKPVLAEWDKSVVFSLRDNGLLLGASEAEILYMGKDTTVERVI